MSKESVFQGRSILACKDLTPQEMMFLVDFSLHLKKLKKDRIPHEYLQGRNIALLFEKTSTRTRSSFVIAAHDLGAHPDFQGPDATHLGKKESIKDTARVLGSMFDGIEFRGFAHEDVEKLAQYAGVPVWNGLTDKWHPTQMFADFMTIKEKFGHIKGLTLAFVGDGRNNMANSLLVAGSMLGVNVHIVAPKELEPAADVVEIARKFAEQSGAKFAIINDVKEGVKGANIIYTDVWVSMGENDWEERIRLLKPYQVTMEMMKATGTPDDKLIFMHCLPAFHNTDTECGQEIYEKYGLTAMEVTDEVFESHYGWQFVEAENRLHSIKAIMAATLGNLYIPQTEIDSVVMD